MKDKKTKEIDAGDRDRRIPDSYYDFTEEKQEMFIKSFKDNPREAMIDYLLSHQLFVYKKIDGVMRGTGIARPEIMRLLIDLTCAGKCAYKNDD